MPTIQESNAPQGLGLQPTETGINATAQAARRIQGAYNEIAASKKETGHALGSAIEGAGGVAVRYMEHQEVSHGAAALAGNLARYTAAWNETAKHADPNDPTVATKFMQGLEPELEKFKGAFHTEGGQKWAEGRVDAMRTHFTNETQAQMARMAGEAFVINERNTVNSLSVAVMSNPTPQSLDFALDTLTTSHNAKVSSSSVAAAHLPKLNDHLESSREALVKSAVVGAIQATGEIPKWVSDPKYSKYITGAELKTFENVARAEQRAQRVDQERADRAAQKKREDAMDQRTDDILVDSRSDKPKITAQDVLKDSTYNGDPKARMAALKLIDMAGKPKKEVSDPAVAAELFSDLTNPEKPVTMTRLLENQNDLSEHDFNRLADLSSTIKKEKLSDPTYQEALHAVKSELTLSGIPGFQAKDPKGAASYANFIGRFLPQYMKLSPDERADALDLANPNSLINKTMTPFKRSIAQKMQDLQSELSLGTSAPATTSPKPPPPSIAKEYPDAFLGPDGKWKVIRDGKQFTVNP